MATGTAPITDKATQATQLRAEAVTLTKELAQLNEKLSSAQSALGALQDKRRELAEAVADGKPAKSSTEIHAKIAEAQLPVEVLQKRVNEKQAALDTMRALLDSLEYELRLDAQRAAQQAKFDLLKKQGGEAVARIAEKLRGLIEEDLPAFDLVRDSFIREFPAHLFNGNPSADPLAHATERLLSELNAALRDGPFLRIERKLLREGWEPRGDVVFEIKNLRPPR